MSDAAATYSVPFWINGEEYHSEKQYNVISPVTGKAVHQSGAASDADVKKAVLAADKAFKTWKKTLPKERRDIFMKAAEIFERRKEELGGYMMQETGASRQWADFNLGVAKDFCLDISGRISTLEGTIPTTADSDTGAMIIKEPFGVILAIAPWNAPYILATRSILFPLAAGNTAILKGSESCPRTMWALSSVFHEAGLPAGVLNTLVHSPPDASRITANLIAEPAVKKINFTGSTGVGRVIGRLAGENLKPVLLELGGKAPAIVWEDADLDNAAFQCALGAFLNSGQICMSTERIIVHKNVKAEFEKKFVGAIDYLFGSAGSALATDEAPILINAAAVARNKGLVRDAVEKGGELLYGNLDDDESPTRMRPVVINNATPDMEIYQTESFGPSVALYEVGTEEEALRMANDTEYGLTSAVFTEDLRRGLRFAKEIETGAVHINSMTVHDESALPHGGAKASGYGRFNTTAGMGEWVRTKTVTYRF